jgi:hypothetical protein
MTVEGWGGGGGGGTLHSICIIIYVIFGLHIPFKTRNREGEGGGVVHPCIFGGYLQGGGPTKTRSFYQFQPRLDPTPPLSYLRQGP